MTVDWSGNRMIQLLNLFQYWNVLQQSGNDCFVKLMIPFKDRIFLCWVEKPSSGSCTWRNVSGYELGNSFLVDLFFQDTQVFDGKIVVIIQCRKCVALCGKSLLVTKEQTIHILVSGMLLKSWKSWKGRLTTRYELLCHAYVLQEFYVIHKVGVSLCEKQY